MKIPVKLKVFEGPMDLLLRLIEENKIDIYDIPIVEITDQYMTYVHSLQEENMEVMSAFLVMAATLLDIKCRMLIAKDEEEEEGEDPRSELVERLLEYKMYRHMAEELKGRCSAENQTVYRNSTIASEALCAPDPVDLEALIGDMNFHDIQKAFSDILWRNRIRVDPVRSRFGKIEREKITVREQMDYVRERLRQKKRLSFGELLEEQPSRLYVIVTFLVILELMKEGEVKVVQEEKFGEIYLSDRRILDRENAGGPYRQTYDRDEDGR